MRSNYKAIGELVERVDIRNTDGSIDTLIGLSIEKCFIRSVANTIGTDLTKYKKIRKNQFAVSLMQVSRDEKIPVACLKEFDEAIMSLAYSIFQVMDENTLLPEYLDMWFKRSEFDREAAFIAVGGVRGSMPWEEFAKMKLPVPPIEKQRSIIKAYQTITNRIALKQQINDNLEAQAFAIFKINIADVDMLQPIYSFGKVITGKTPPTSVPEYYGNDISFIKTPDMHGSVYITSSECSLSTLGADSQSNKYIPEQTVIVACIGANAGEVSLTSYLAQTNQQINGVVTKYPCFLYFSVKTNTAELRVFGEGSSTMININKTSFENYEIPTPDLEKLDLLEKQLKKFFALILYNQQEIDRLSEMKELLIAQLSR